MSGLLKSDGYPAFVRYSDIYLDKAQIELSRACLRYPTHPSLEHSLAVLEEEVSELRDVVRKQYEDRDFAELEEEAIQVAAMAIRLLQDYSYLKDRGRAYDVVEDDESKED